MDLRQATLPAGAEHDARHRTAPAVAAVIGDQAVAQRAVGELLQARIEGGAHRQAATVELVLAEAREQVAAHFLGEVVCADHVARPALADLQRLGACLLEFLTGDVAVLEHASEHPVAPRDRGVVVAHRMVVARPLGQRREIGDLGQRQVVERTVEVVERRGGDAERPPAEEDLVEIELEDAILRQRALEAQGEQRLTDLARDRELVAQEEIARHLLGDGARPDRPPVAAVVHQVLQARAQNVGHADAGVRVEALVLGGDEGVDHALGHLPDRYEDAPLVRELGHDPAVIGVHAGQRRRVVVDQLLIFGQVLGNVPDGERREPARDHRGDRDQDENLREEPANLDHDLPGKLTQLPIPQFSSVQGAERAAARCRKRIFLAIP
jgi:hypothetical protein